jgi:hypothetical protein
MYKITKHLLIAVVFYLLIIYISNFVAENQINHSINDPPLFDRGHNLLPIINKDLPNIGLVLFLFYFLFRWGSQFKDVLINYLWIISILFIGRMFIFSITQLPPAFKDCKSVTDSDFIHFNLFKDGWNECIDYMFSGHTMHCVLIAIFTLYLSKYTFEKVLIVLATIIEIVFIIGSRIHYSADVLVATLITILAFFSWPGINRVIKTVYTGGLYFSLKKRAFI